MEIMLQENIKGIKINTLCTKLGVTKGSFYWHFSKRSDLLVSMLKQWRQRMTMNIIRKLKGRSEQGFDWLKEILRATRHPRADHYASIEMNIRDWARRNEMPRDAIQEVDQTRINFFEQIFMEDGFSKEEAVRRAYMAYCIQMGDAILNKSMTTHLDEEEFLKTSLSLLRYRP